MQNLERIKQQWAKELPELDTSTMELVGRLQVIHKHMASAMNNTFRQFGLTDAGFDVLATLRRSGKPYRLTPNQLLEQMLVTSGSMTSRLTLLQKKGFVTREQDENDGRVNWVKLTDKGLVLSNQVIHQHVQTQERLLSVLSESERLQLTEQLSRYLKRQGLE
ncbi:MAG TPA: MarR family transcriptional regulator [Idiomarina abyssalis]|jgi:DNA-binding MarR family transcriptional regulator|uniref:MarR family winged helix-turn-helix transcriptional regulator n=1 Tax=Idiomarina TaxID=135575 RepID=UPI000C5677C7|nr:MULTISPECIES: MarR family transcriptional regulator [Idiomarina]MAB21006.1 MarR family transcriptional regulator [Idiomarina sp.]MBH94010.1 MarR family transcriptional regulator [Idiomarina sp.]HAS14176.1 MarR family transcriptional regulator [Idiomarina abyssalis]|tara:strand:- start:371 stop:859 length:489 start_codon:yes stop_codon:yes gene_type:complete